ncbi:RNA-binding protein 1-like [Zingiber officinale]|uniref:RRM domain-containing protein n=1 Tax=Zingiber officinale TaxID=94328 RepID=A0A8J5F372_ZINOF|nr:RNA-binding protein 1-like [Zingiber officinale]KAG6480536.1 hypothetical protein ZIOFF_057120 [Zingiber officinale]
MELPSSSPPPTDAVLPPFRYSTSDATGPLSASENGVKLFVGGISSGMKAETLRTHFEKFGLVEATVMKDRLTGKCRGFGFVRFAETEAAEKALKNPNPLISGRTVEVKRAIPKGQINHTNQKQFLRERSISSRNNNWEINNGNPKKIFIGGLPGNLTQLELRSFFEKFGSVVDSVVMYDNMTQRPRGFGFITFSSDDPVTMVLKNSFYQLKGKLVQVKLAVPKDDSYRLCRNDNDNEHCSPRAVATNGLAEPDYGIYQHTFYPRYGDYGYFNYYVAAPCPPYLYGGLYGGYNPSGVLGIRYNDYLGNSRSPLNVGSGVMVPVTYPPHVADGFRSNMFVPTLCYAGDHGSESSKETSCRETEVILHIDQ